MKPKKDKSDKYGLLTTLLAALILHFPLTTHAAFTPPAFVNSNASTDSTVDNLPTIATGVNGTIVAVWAGIGPNALDPDGSDPTTGDNLNEDLFFSRSTDNGLTWSARGVLKTNAANDHADDIEPCIATDGQGGWMVVWRSKDPLGGTIGYDNDVLMTYSSDDGRTWSPPAPVNNDAYSDPGGYSNVSSYMGDHGPTVCSDGKGHWVVSWIRYDHRTYSSTGINHNSVMVATSSDHGVTWTDPKALQTRDESGFTGIWTPFALTTDHKGRWILGWCSRTSSTSDTDIYYAISDSNGASWTTPALLNTDGASDSGADNEPQLATDGQGHWIVMWTSNDTLGGTLPSTVKILYAVSNDNGQTWSAPKALDSEVAINTSANVTPQVAYDGAGHWIVAWSTNSLGGDVDFLYTVSKTDKIQWGKIFPVNPGVLSDSGAESDNGLRLAGDGQGHVMAIWSSAYNLNNQNLNHDLDIIAAPWVPDSENWPVVVNSNAVIDSTPDNQSTIAAGSNGTMVCVWVAPSANSLDARGSDEATGNSVNEDLYFARSTDQGRTWSGRAPLKTNFASDFYDDIEPSITTDGKGKWMVVWRSRDPLNGTIGFDRDILMTYSSDDGLTWSAPAPVNNDAASDPGGILTDTHNAYDYRPAVCTDGLGHWMVTWVRCDNRSGSWVNSIMIAASSDGGAHWSAPYFLQTQYENGMSGVAEPSVATNEQGRWIACWASRNSSSSDYDLYFSISNNNGSSWSAPALLNSNGATDSGEDGGPAIANDTQGHWIATWHSTDTLGGTLPSNAKILFAISTDNGQTWSAPAPLNANAATDTSSNTYPQVVYDGEGNWVAGWITNKLGGDTDFFYAMCETGTTEWTDAFPINSWALTDTGAICDNGLRMASDRLGHWIVTTSSAYDAVGNNLGHDLDILVIGNLDTPGMLGPTVGANPTSLAYRKGTRYQVDVTRHDPPTTQGLTLNNLGLKKLKVTGLRFTGVHAADYSLVSTPTLPLTFSALTSQSLQVKFAPKETGYTLDLDAALEILSNDSTNPLFTIPIVGDAVPVRLGSFGVE